MKKNTNRISIPSNDGSEKKNSLQNNTEKIDFKTLINRKDFTCHLGNDYIISICSENHNDK